MNRMKDEQLEEYYREAESWSEDRLEATQRSLRLAWIAAGVAALIAVVEAFTLVALIPLKREVPYILTVDRQTGYNPADQSARQRRADRRCGADPLVPGAVRRRPRELRHRQPAGGLPQGRPVVGGRGARPVLALMKLEQSAEPARHLAAPGDHRGADPQRVVAVANSAMVRFSTVRTDPGGRRKWRSTGRRC
jgi:type IV secretion system protein VirB8